MWKWLVSEEDDDVETEGSRCRCPCGLRNLGNTCYMNSVLQCLAHTTPLKEFFTGKVDVGVCPGTTGSQSWLYKEYINRNNPDGTGGVLAEVYGNLMERMCCGSDIILKPEVLKDVIGSYAPRFAGYSQQDAQELLTFLLDGLHEDLNRVQGEKPYVDMTLDEDFVGGDDEVIAEETWRKHSQRNNSAIVDIFQGLIRHQVICPNCKIVTKTFEPVMQLTISVTESFLQGLLGYQTSLRQLLEEFSQEKRANENNWICNNCNGQCKPWRKADVWKTPPILIIHLKRFKTCRSGHTKINIPIEFPYRIDFIGDNAEKKGVHYDLYAVINHSGMLFSGHYTAFVKLADRWYHCDDSRVKEVRKSELWQHHVRSTVYMLFYIKM